MGVWETKRLFYNMIRVVVNGTFDILHLGHLELLNYARGLGDHLTVAIDTDRRVTEKKGPSRPINNQHERLTMLKNLRCVDQVLLFDTDQELVDIIKQCNIMVKGSDYRGRSVLGEKHVAKVIYYDRVGEYSTTNKIQNIIDRG